MSIPLTLKPNIHRLLVILPLLLLVVSLGTAIWFGLRVQALPIGRKLVLPTTLTRAPKDAEKAVRIPLVHNNGSEGKDPFIRPSGSDGRSKSAVMDGPDLFEIHLTMIARGGAVRLCLINGVLMKEGESTSGFTVKEIKVRGALLKRGAEEFVLYPGQKAIFAGRRLREIIDLDNQGTETTPAQSSRSSASKEEVDNGNTVPAR